MAGTWLTLLTLSNPWFVDGKGALNRGDRGGWVGAEGLSAGECQRHNPTYRNHKSVREGVSRQGSCCLERWGSGVSIYPVHHVLGFGIAFHRTQNFIREGQSVVSQVKWDQLIGRKEVLGWIENTP